MNIITQYNNVADLKRQIVAAYLQEVEKEAKSCARTLADKNWASTDTEYHKRCRSGMEEKVKQADKQIKLLQPKNS